MKSWIFAAAMVVAAGSLVGCGSKGSGSSAGGGGAGGSEGGSTGGTGGSTNTTTTTTSSSSSTTSSSSSSTTSGGACDNTGVCQDMDQDTTNDCVSCALADPCSGQLQACGQEPDCCTPQADGSCGADSFVGCIDACAQGDQACFDACGQAHQTGAGLYNDLVVCAICDQCPIDCDGPGSGCP